MKVAEPTALSGHDAAPEAFADTQTEFDEDLIRTEAEELAENLFRTSYYDLPLGLKVGMRSRAIEALWPNCATQEPIDAA
jgi:hypothetical protein